VEQLGPKFIVAGLFRKRIRRSEPILQSAAPSAPRGGRQRQLPSEILHRVSAFNKKWRRAVPTHRQRRDQIVFLSFSMRSDSAHTNETAAKKMAPIQRSDFNITRRATNDRFAQRKMQKWRPKFDIPTAKLGQNETAQNRSNSSLESNIPFDFLASRTFFGGRARRRPSNPRGRTSAERKKSNNSAQRTKIFKTFHFSQKVRCGVFGQIFNSQNFPQVQ
jgi:hypothetical protein